MTTSCHHHWLRGLHPASKTHILMIACGKVHSQSQSFLMRCRMSWTTLTKMLQQSKLYSFTRTECCFSLQYHNHARPVRHGLIPNSYCEKRLNTSSSHDLTCSRQDWQLRGPFALRAFASCAPHLASGPAALLCRVAKCTRLLQKLPPIEPTFRGPHPIGLSWSDGQHCLCILRRIRAQIQTWV